MKIRKVLIISYIWPPAEGVGLLRALKFARYLPECGWQPVIITVKAQKGAAPVEENGSGRIKVFRTEYRDILGDVKRLILRDRATAPISSRQTRVAAEGGGEKNTALSFLREFVAIPDEQVGWLRYGIREGSKIIDEEKIDLIFSTSPPETAHLIASGLKRGSRIPWVADLRDLWAEDHFRSRPFLKKAILKLMERVILRSADAVVTVSEPWAGQLRSFLKKDAVNVIENGFDDEDFNSLTYSGNDKFTISYTGKLHKKHQSLDLFFKALKRLIGDGLIDRSRIAVRFYVFGYDKPDIFSAAGCYGLDDVVSCYPRVSYRESLALQRASDALLFVQWQGRGGEGWYSAKLYDYIGSGRPILALAREKDVAGTLIARTSSGIIANDEASVMNGILTLYREHEKTGRVSYHGRMDEIMKQTRSSRARELAGIFDSVMRVRER